MVSVCVLSWSFGDWEVQKLAPHQVRGQCLARCLQCQEVVWQAFGRETLPGPDPKRKELRYWTESSLSPSEGGETSSLTCLRHLGPVLQRMQPKGCSQACSGCRLGPGRLGSVIPCVGQQDSLTRRTAEVCSCERPSPATSPCHGSLFSRGPPLLWQEEVPDICQRDHAGSIAAHGLQQGGQVLRDDRSWPPPLRSRHW